MEKAKIFQSIVKGSNFFTPIKKDSPLTCSDCERWGTMDCPNSYMCYSTKDKPYFKSKQDE